MKIHLKSFYLMIHTLMILILAACDISNEQATLEYLQKIKYIPATAEQIYLRDNHGGLHGDGMTFVTFISGEEQPSFISENTQLKPLPLDVRAQKTFDVVCESLKIEPKVKPNLNSSTLRYFVDDSRDYRAYMTGHLYIIDSEARRFWYFNYTE